MKGKDSESTSLSFGTSVHRREIIDEFKKLLVEATASLDAECPHNQNPKRALPPSPPSNRLVTALTRPVCPMLKYRARNQTCDPGVVPMPNRTALGGPRKMTQKALLQG